jgi:hypothetical protein
MDREVGASGVGEEEENELGRMKRMWEREKAGKRRLEDELMVLQGKHLGAVSRIARSVPSCLLSFCSSQRT